MKLLFKLLKEQCQHCDLILPLAQKFIRERSGRKLTVQKVVSYVGVSETVLQDLFQKECGHSVAEEIMAARLERAGNRLQEMELSLQQVARRAIHQDHRLGNLLGMQSGPVKSERRLDLIA